MGIMGAWRNAWSWKEEELFIVIEDDVEMSPHWYKALLHIARKTLLIFGTKSGTEPLSMPGSNMQGCPSWLELASKSKLLSLQAKVFTVRNFTLLEYL